MSPRKPSEKEFLPITRDAMRARGWNSLDVLFISGDAYIDHPAFGIPLLARFLESQGYRVGIIAEPNLTAADFARMGTPRLFVGISSGTVDSMLNNYTANKKPRSDNMYSEGGKAGKRPDYASIVYSKIAREAFPHTPIFVGGVEVSLRRLAHYDYWQNRVRPSVMCDLHANALAFGMGEHTISSIANILRESAAAQNGKVSLEHSSTQEALQKIFSLRGIAYLTTKEIARGLENRVTIPSYEEVKEDKKKFAKAALFIEQEANPYNGRKIVQYHAARAVVVNEAPLPLTTAEYDAIYALPFTKHAHPAYTQKIPAEEMIKHSLAINRGCYGGCSFCAITLHQGRIVQCRSRESIVRELENLKKQSDFTGHVSDLGGPSANMWRIGCKSEHIQSKCRKLSCLFPKVCPHLQNNHAAQVELLKLVRNIPGIKSVRIASGIRYDMALADKDSGLAYLREVIQHHVGGQLKVAPEHMDEAVLQLMRKPSGKLFDEFLKLFHKYSAECGKEQYVIPYFISGFPGCTHEQMETVNKYLTAKKWNVQQVQAFIPTPMTLATAMYYTGLDPLSKDAVFVAKDWKDRKIQQALLQPKRHEHKKHLPQKPEQRSPANSKRGR
jgi:uncharacterized radical SAM protein YgiQ